jgi:general secretion pathway protein L
MLDVLRQPIDIEHIKANFRGWFERQASTLCRWLPQWLLEDKVVFEIKPVGTTHFKIVALVNGNQVESAELQASELRSAWPTIFSLGLSATRGGRTTHLVLPANLCLIKKLHFPKTAIARSTDFAELQIDAETPFNREDVYFDAIIEAHPSDDGQQTMELAVAPRELVDPVLSTLVEAEISVDSVTTPPAGTASKRHNLLPHQQGHFISRNSGIAIALVGLLTLQLCLLVSLPLYLRAEMAATLETHADGLVSKASKISDAFAKAADDLSVAGRVVNEKRTQNSLLSTLKALTSALPDDSYLDRTKYERDQVEITGFTPSTTTLIDRLSKQRGFSSPTYVSPVTRDQQSNLERFDLSFKLLSGAER